MATILTSSILLSVADSLDIVRLLALSVIVYLDWVDHRHLMPVHLLQIPHGAPMLERVVPAAVDKKAVTGVIMNEGHVGE